MKEKIKERIKKIKKKKNALIFVHSYQNEEIHEVADYLGDSLELSRLAAETSASTIIFAGVKFMAETAKVLSPDKKVLLPRLDAGCPMASMVMAQDVLDMKKKHPDAAVVTYVNSSVEVKAVSDYCCTSANAHKVMQKIPNKKIIFVPDKNLGRYSASFVPDKEVILYDGYCYVHERIDIEDIKCIMQKHPKAIVMAHPECNEAVSNLSHHIASTSGMLKIAKESDNKEFIIVTEEGLIQRMRNEMKNKIFYSANRVPRCSNMKLCTLEDIETSLQKDIYEIELSKELIDKAGNVLRNMLK